MSRQLRASELRADIRPEFFFWGINGAAPAIDLSRYAPLPRDRRLSSILTPETFKGHRQWGFESEYAVRRSVTCDRACLGALRDSKERSGRSRREAAEASALLHGLSRPVANLASAHFGRRYRDCLGSHIVAALAAEQSTTPIRFYTILLSEHLLLTRELHRFHPANLLMPFRAQLYRNGISKLGGWAIFVLHGEHQPGGCLDPHVHVLAVGEKAQAIERLRHLDQYIGGAEARVQVPIAGYPATNVPRQVSYLLQQNWPLKQETSVLSERYGERGRRRNPPRLDHARYLLWRAGQRGSDLTWMHGIRLQDGFLKPTTASTHCS